MNRRRERENKGDDPDEKMGPWLYIEAVNCDKGRRERKREKKIRFREVKEIYWMGTMEKKKQRCESLRYSETHPRGGRERQEWSGFTTLCVWKKDQKTNQERPFKG